MAERMIGLWVVVRDRRGKALAATALDGAPADGKIGAATGREPDADAAGIPGIVPLAGASRSITASVTELEGSSGTAI